MDETPPDRADDGSDAASSAIRRTAQLRARTRATTQRLGDRFVALQERSSIVDLGVRVYERDREAAGTLMGSALALRLFLYFVPLVLFTIGFAGLISQYTGYNSLSSDALIGGAIGDQVDSAFAQSSNSAWFISAVGLIGAGSAGYSLSRALIVSSALSWRLGGRQRTTIGVIGLVAGLIASIGLVGVIVNAIRTAAGLAVASVSFVAVLGVYLALWLLIFQALPRGTSDPAASLPGALLASLTLTTMQAVSTLYLPRAVANSSELYGTIGIVLVTLGWIYLIGRVLAFSFSLNATIFEEYGSVSSVVFSIPGLRAIPRRYPRIARYFDLEPE